MYSHKIKCLTALISATLVSSANAVVVFSEDFSTLSTLPNNTQGTLGFFNGNIDTGVIGVSSNASISNEELIVDTTNGFRGIGLAFDQADLGAAGTYTFSYDLLNITNPDATNVVTANIFAGDNFDNGNNGDAILLNAQTGILTALGEASSTQLATQSTNTTGTQSVSFEYDGSSTVAIFLGTETGGFPFPEATIDNLSLSTEVFSTTEAIPEPSSSLLILLGSAFLCTRRRRN